MSDQKIQVEIARGLESEDTYKQVVPGVLKKINSADKAYITNSVKLTSTIITSSKYDPVTKYWALLLLKDIMQLNQSQFATALADSNLLPAFETIVNKNPKTEQEMEQIFGKQADPKYSKRFFVLLKECLKVWALRYKDAKGSQQKYNTIYNNLTKKGIQFPTTYFFFPNKDNKDAKPEPAAQSGQTGPANDQRILAIIDKLRKNFEALEQEFYYNAQDIEEDPDFPDKPASANTNSIQQKAPVAQTQNQLQPEVQPQTQVQSQSNQNQAQPQSQKQQVQEAQAPEEELLPLMYNAQELEIDGPDESLYSKEEFSSVKDNRKVEKFNGNESGMSTSKVPEVNKQNMMQSAARGQNEAGNNNNNNITTSQTNTGGNKQSVISQSKQLEQQRKESGNGNEIEDVKIKIDPNSIQEHVQGKNTLQLSKVNSLMDSNTLRNEGSMTFKPGGKDGIYSEQDQGKGSLSQFRPQTSTGRSIEQLEEESGNKKEKSSILDLWKVKKPSEIQVPEYESPTKSDGEALNTQQIKEINIKIQTDLIPNEDTKNKIKKKDVIDSKLEILSNIEKGEIRSQLSESDAKKLAQMKYTPTEQKTNITSNLVAQSRSPKLETPANKSQEDIVRKEVLPKSEKSIRQDQSKSEQSIRYELKQIEKSMARENLPVKKDSLNVQNLKSGYMESYQSIEPSREDTISCKQPREYVSPKSSNLGEGKSKGNVDVQRLKSGNIESYQSLDENRSLMLKHLSPKSGPINADRESRKQDSFEALQLKSGNIESYQSLEEERERKISMSSKQREYVSPKSGPLIANKDLIELKQRNDLLSQENKEIKARLKDLELKMRDESEKTKVIQEKIDKREENSFMGTSLRSHSASRKNTAKTEMASNPRNKFLSTETSDYFAGARSLGGSAQKSKRGISPKVESFKSFNNTMTSFGAELRNLNGWNIEPLHSPDLRIKTMTNFYSSNASPFYATNMRTKSDFSPAGTMLKTEFFQRKQEQPAIWKKLNQALRKSFVSHDELPFATNLYRFKLNCLKDHETLFENEFIKIETVSYYLPNRSGVVVIELIYTNKGQIAIEDFSVTYKSVLGFEIVPEDTHLSTSLIAGEKQTHRLHNEINGYPQDVGLMVVEFKLNEEPCQYKLNFPLIVTKFMDFAPIIGSEFIRKRKELVSSRPTNIEESIKLKVSKDYLKVLQESLFSKLILVPPEGGSEKRFTIYGGCFRVGTSKLEYILRIILENDTQLLLIQVAYPLGGEQDARLILEKLVFLCNEYSLL